MTAALIVCLLGGPGGGTLCAADLDHSPSDVSSARTWFAGPPPVLERSLFTLTNQSLLVDPSVAAARTQAWRDTFNFIPADSTLLAQRGYRRHGGVDNSGPAAAIIIGAAAAIAGGAILVYANRPDCRIQRADGCGYGTKVAGGALLAGGLVAVIGGAVTWR